MQRIRRLSNPIREYAWGSRTALAELAGRASPSPTPEAELWIGAHASAPSWVETEAGRVSLIEWIARDPDAVLGSGVAARFGSELPFLFKVIAPARALSIQTHPDTQRAVAGFARENAAGLALDDPRRSYRDPRAKPELICALDEFDALCGFRPAAEIAAGLAVLGAAAAAPRSALDAGVEACFRALWSEATDRSLLARVAAAAAQGQDADDWRCVTALAREYPGDVGVLAPLLLNRVRLAPGEALFLPPGELHAYLSGVGVELMGNSDNVLRGGLTPKHVDVPELLAALRFDCPAQSRVATRERAAGERIYETPAPEFQLSALTLAGGVGYRSEAERSVEILLCVDGEVRVEGAVAAGAERCRRGETLLVPAAAGSYALSGEARVFRAGVPASAK
jgi:mannose-6-phosphate isomerase